MKESCSKCNGGNDRLPQRYCKSCHAEYMRMHRPKHSELTPRAKWKANARSMANVYQNRGSLSPEPCKKCGSEDVQKHHEDYSKPLEVTWLCKDCHLEHHNGS